MIYRNLIFGLPSKVVFSSTFCYLSFWVCPSQWPQLFFSLSWSTSMTFSAMNRLLNITGYRMKDRNRNGKTEFRFVGPGFTKYALDKKWGFSFSSTTSLKSKVDIGSRNLLHQVDYRGRFFWSLSYHDSWLLYLSIIRQA